ncbi:MAG: hypothetical protein JW951_00340 [Lentisphaerae bacterium]|nr:hypothetical protein [Lentisphaerota bacterium]
MKHAPSRRFARPGLAAWLVPLCALAAPAGAPDAPDTFVQTAPVTAAVTVEGAERTVTLVGRAPGRVLFTVGEDAVGARSAIEVDRIEAVRFDLELDETEVFRDLRRRNWLGAARRLLPAVRPALPYLDLPANDAAEPALRAGDGFMRAAARRADLAETPEQEAFVREQFETAYGILTQAAAARFSPVGALAELKAAQCLLALGKTAEAAAALEAAEEPLPGDAAYGLYWLARAQAALEAGAHRAALDAAVKSAAFETKDIDTFPDALLAAARAYESIGNPYRARDVYVEVASVFPGTDWSETARRRLAAILDRGLTDAEEPVPIKTVFFGLKEDMNARARELLAAEDALQEEETE